MKTVVIELTYWSAAKKASEKLPKQKVNDNMKTMGKEPIINHLSVKSLEKLFPHGGRVAVRLRGSENRRTETA